MGPDGECGDGSDPVGDRLGAGETVMLSMFVVSEADVTVDPRMSWEGYRPLSVSPFELEDAAGRLSGRRVVEYDAVFGAVPDDLTGYLSHCLHEAMDRGAEL